MALRAGVQRAALVIIVFAASATFIVSASAQNAAGSRTPTPRLDPTKRGPKSNQGKPNPKSSVGQAAPKSNHGHHSKRHKNSKPGCASAAGHRRSKRHARHCPKASDTFMTASKPVGRTAISAPHGLSAAAGDQEVSLSWGAPGGKTAIAGYWVYRSGVEVAQTTTRSYTDKGLTDGDTYSYYVVAHDASGNDVGRVQHRLGDPSRHDPTGHSHKSERGCDLGVRRDFGLAPRRQTRLRHPSVDPRPGPDPDGANGSWTESPTSYAYQWQACNSSGASCANLGGATSSSHNARRWRRRPHGPRGRHRDRPHGLRYSGFVSDGCRYRRNDQRLHRFLHHDDQPRGQPGDGRAGHVSRPDAVPELRHLRV